MIRIFFLSLFLSCTYLSAKEVSYPMRSPRALLMGDAFTSLATDEYAIFYNPAAQARHHGFTMSTFNPYVSMSNILDDMDKFDNLPDDPNLLAQQILGYPIHFGAGIASGFKVNSFSMVGYSTQNTNIMLNNVTSPVMDIDYKLDNGFAVSYATHLGPNKLNKEGHGQQLSLGVSARYYKRRQIDDTFPLFGTDVLDILDANSSEITEIMGALGPKQGKAWAYDLGLEYIAKSAAQEFAIGVSALDAFGTKFDSTDPNDPIDDQEMRLNFGMSWSQNLGIANLTLATDLHPILEPIPSKRKLHMGAALEFGNLEFLGGYNAGYLSYGIGIDFWAFQVYAGLYEIEVGSKYKEKKSKRGIIYFNLAEFHFDY